MSLPSLVFAALSTVQAAPHTPSPGASERIAICDGLRAHFSKQSMKPLPDRLAFRIDFLRVEGGYASFEGAPMFKDRPAIDGIHMPDVGYYALLKRSGDRWKVILDLSRSDVPSEQEVKELQARVPHDFPSSVLSDFWRRHLRP